MDAGIFLVDFLVLVWLNSPESQGGLDACPHFRKNENGSKTHQMPGCDAGRLFLWILIPALARELGEVCRLAGLPPSSMGNA